MTVTMARDSIRFLIVTPTYRRPWLLQRAISSVLKQAHQNWHFYICDDCSKDETEELVNSYIVKDHDHAARFTFIKQTSNGGVNKARNSILDKIAEQQESGYLVMLDDDDFLTDLCFARAIEELEEHPEEQWLVSNCITPEGKKITRITNYGSLSYLKDYMFGKSMKGDLCHIVHTDIGLQFRFTQEIKNGEEWYYFCQLATLADIHAYNFDGMVRDYQPGGISKTGINHDRKLEVNYLKVKLLTELCSNNECIDQRLSLVRSLLEHRQLDEARAELAGMADSARFKLRYWRYQIKLMTAGFRR